MENDEDDEESIGGMIEKLKQKNQAFAKILKGIEDQSSVSKHSTIKKNKQ